MLRLESNVTPPVVIFDEAAREEGGGGLTAWVRPRIAGSLPFIGPVELAPYGEPVPGLGTVVFLTVLALAAIGAVTLMRRI